MQAKTGETTGVTNELNTCFFHQTCADLLTGNEGNQLGDEDARCDGVYHGCYVSFDCLRSECY